MDASRRQLYLAWCKEGESDAVLQLCWQNLDACRKQDDPICIIWALNDLAAVLIGQGIYFSPINHWREAVELASVSANTTVTSFLLRNMAYALFLTRNFLEAHEAMKRSFTQQPATAYGLSLFAEIALCLGDREEARECYQQAQSFLSAESYPPYCWLFFWGQHSLWNTEATPLTSLEVALKMPSESVSLAKVMLGYGILEGRAGNHERAVECLSLGLSHAAVPSWMNNHPLIAPILTHAQDELSSEQYTLAWKRGRTLPLRAMVKRHVTLAEEKWPLLTERELEVLLLMSQGYSNQQIATHLVVSINTIKKHLAHIYHKFGVTSRTQALLRAKEHNLIK